MEIMLILFLIFICIVFSLINHATVGTITRMNESSDIVEEVEADSIKESGWEGGVSDVSDWGKPLGFVHECYFLFNGGITPVPCSVWICEKSKTRLLAYCFERKRTVDFSTEYSDGFSLTTASTKDAVSLPSKPKYYIQAFDNKSLEDKYEAHIIASKKIIEHHAVSPRFDELNILQTIRKEIKIKTDYIMNLHLWKIRGVYWFLIRRNLMVNKAIKLKSNKRIQAIA